MDKRWVGGKEYHGFLSKNVCLTVPKNLVGKPSVFHYFQLSENFMPLRGISRLSKETLLSHSTEKLRRGTFIFYTNFLVPKYFLDKRRGVEEGGVSRYSVKSFLSQSTEKLRTEPFCASLIQVLIILCL